MAKGALPYPPQLIDKLCFALGYDDADRQHVHRLFKRHERGQATRPERTLLHVLSAMAAPGPTKLTDNWEELLRLPDTAES